MDARLYLISPTMATARIEGLFFRPDLAKNHDVACSWAATDGLTAGWIHSTMAAFFEARLARAADSRRLLAATARRRARAHGGSKALAFDWINRMERQTRVGPELPFYWLLLFKDTARFDTFPLRKSSSRT